MLVLGDILLLYGALFVMLAVRYGAAMGNFIGAHIGPFSIVFAFWLILFYIIGLYDLQTFREKLALVQNIVIAVGVGVVLAVVVFYIIPYFQIAPKTNLVIFAGIFGVLELIWRMFFAAVTKVSQKRAMIIGGDHGAGEMEEMIPLPAHGSAKCSGSHPGNLIPPILTRKEGLSYR